MRGKVFGRISLQNIDRYAAFSEADIRLLTTLTSGLSVALENARLFDETQRLLTETNERAAELAIINSVQEGLVAKLDMQSMYDLVGDKIQEIFNAQVVDIGIYDFEEDVTRYPYTIEKGERLPDDPTQIGRNHPVPHRLLRQVGQAAGDRQRRTSGARRKVSRSSRWASRQVDGDSRR